jgi:hypothetical protein
MIDHRVAQVPANPAAIAVAYTDRSQEADVQAIILGKAFSQCLTDLGQWTQSGLVINADFCQIKRDSYVCSKQH